MTAAKQQYTRTIEISATERIEIMHAMFARLELLRDRVIQFGNNDLQTAYLWEPECENTIREYYTTAGYLMRNHWVNAAYLELRVWAA